MNFDSLINMETIVSFLLVLFRIAGIFFVAPLLGNRAIPAQVQMFLALTMGILISPSIHFHDPLAYTSDWYLMTLILQEVTIGVMIGFAAAVLFAVVQIAGEIFGMNVGFSIAQIIDPSNEGSSGVLTSLYVLMGGLIFIQLDGHHLIIQALIQSFQLIPIGSGIELSGASVLSGFLVKILVLGIKIAAPLIIVMTLLYLAFGFITKLSPQMNIYFNVGFILGPVLGIFVLMLSFPLFRILMTRLTQGLEGDLIHLMRALKGA